MKVVFNVGLIFGSLLFFVSIIVALAVLGLGVEQFEHVRPRFELLVRLLFIGFLIATFVLWLSGWKILIFHWAERPILKNCCLVAFHVFFAVPSAYVIYLTRGDCN